MNKGDRMYVLVDQKSIGGYGTYFTVIGTGDYTTLLDDEGRKMIKFHNRESEERASLMQILEYEIHSHWLASWVGFAWGHQLLGAYFAWKAKRKHARYIKSMNIRAKLKKLGKIPITPAIFRDLHHNA